MGKADGVGQARRAQILVEVKRDYVAFITVSQRIASLVHESADAATTHGFVRRAREWLGGRPEPGKGSR